MDTEAGIVWSSVSKEDLAEMEATSKETSGILDELISTIPDADIHVLFTEMEDGGLKASARSSATVDVSALAGKLFGGGGHPRAAGFKVKEFSNFDLAVVDCVQKLKTGMQEQKAEASTAVPNNQTQIPSPPPAPAPLSPEPASTPQGTDVVEELSDKDKDAQSGTDVVSGLSA